MKKALLLILTLFATTTLFSQSFTVNDINYQILGENYAIANSTPNFSGAAIIPNTVAYYDKEYMVREVYGTFRDCPGLTSVSIPNSVTRIGWWAFRNCTGLTSIELPNSVTSIGEGAFIGCDGLTSLIIPNSVTNIEVGVFSDCRNLISISLPNAMTNLEDGTFYGCESLKTIGIPNSVTNIGDNAFTECTNLISINIPNSVTNIGHSAFSECYELTSIDLPNSLISIGESAFRSCFSLRSLKLANSVNTIGDYAILRCHSLTSLDIPNSVTSIGNNAISSCSNLTAIKVNWATPLALNANVFENTPIASATLYVPVGTLAAYKAAPVWKDFGTIIEMQPITFTNNGINFKVTSPTTIEITATSTFTGVLTIPSNITYEGITYDVTSIANNAFAGSGITTINIPSTVIYIGDYAFANLTGLTAVTVNWTTPLVINANVFGDVPIIQAIGYKPNRTLMSNKVTTAVSGTTNIGNATLFVPAMTESTYRSALVWKDFGTITASSLPLTLTSLTAKAISGGNQINWQTADVINVKNITLERSGEDNNFSPLVILPSSTVQYLDINPLPRNNYYRLSSTDNDGTSQTYPLIVFVKGLSKEVTFYPNPISNGILNVVAGSYKIESVALFDLNGKKAVFVKTKGNSQSLTIPTQGLAKGIYVLEIKGEKTFTNKKVVVN